MKETYSKLKNASILLTRDAIAAVATIITAYFAANFLEASTYGTYKYVLSVVAIVFAFTLSGAGVVLLREAAKGKNYLNFFFFKQLKYSLFPSLLVLLVSIYYFFKGNSDFGLIFLLTAVTQPLIISTSLYSGLLNGIQKYRLLALFSVCSQIILCLALSLTYISTNNVLIIVTVFFLVSLFLNSFFYVLTNQLNNAQGKLDAPTNQSNDFAKHLSVMDILVTLSNRLDEIITFQFLGPAALAQYTFALVPIKQIKSINKVLQSLVAPKYSQYSDKQILSQIHKKALLYLLFILLLIVMYWLSADLFYKYLFPQYIGIADYSKLFSLGLLSMPTVFYGEYLISKQKTKDLYKLKIYIPVLKISLLLILVPTLGMIGLLIAFLSSRAVHLILAIFLTIRPSS